MTETRPYTARDLGDPEERALKERAVEGFGDRLLQLRRRRGLTQAELGAKVGATNRMIAYYEQEGAQPPGAMLAELALALGVSTDELLGLKPPRQLAAPKTARLLKRLEKVAELPPNDQRAVVKFVEALSEARRSKPQKRRRTASG